MKEKHTPDNTVENTTTEKSRIVRGDKPSQARVYYFNDNYFNGYGDAWNLPTMTHDDLSNEPSYRAISSLLVTRGECEITNATTQTFGGVDTEFYRCTGGKNNAGIWETRGEYNDRGTALRVQHDEITRDTSKPYLVLRDDYITSTSGKSKIFEGDNPQVNFPAQVMFAIGSPTGKWYLYSEPDYKGELFIIDVNGGNSGQGVEERYADETFYVGSVRTTPSDTLQGEWLTYDPQTFTSFIITNETGRDVDLVYRFHNGDTKEETIVNNTGIAFDVEEDRGIVIGGDYQEIIRFSFNGTGSGKDINISTGHKMTYTSGGTGDMDVLNFETNKYLDYFTDPSGIDGHGSITFDFEFTDFNAGNDEMILTLKKTS